MKGTPQPLLRPARRPPHLTSSRSGALAGLLIGTGLGAILFFGWVLPGLGLVIAGVVVR